MAISNSRLWRHGLGAKGADAEVSGLVHPPIPVAFNKMGVTVVVWRSAILS
ncbi:MAG: hypothetical protein IJW79_08430 [Clostridia bacterium]|nr:hypothetical protein [Clostridia bacterium]